MEPVQADSHGIVVIFKVSCIPLLSHTKSRSSGIDVLTAALCFSMWCFLTGSLHQVHLGFEVGRQPVLLAEPAVVAVEALLVRGGPLWLRVVPAEALRFADQLRLCCFRHWLNGFLRFLPAVQAVRFLAGLSCFRCFSVVLSSLTRCWLV